MEIEALGKYNNAENGYLKLWVNFNETGPIMAIAKAKKDYDNSSTK